ncbi:MAG: SDR family oxidoreductase [Sphingomonas sp.]
MMTTGPNAKTVLVTGGAQRIGAAIVTRLAGRGHRVVIHYRRSEAEAGALQQALASQGAQIWTVRADLSEPEAAHRLITSAAERAGTVVDGLVNSASLFDYDAPIALRPALFDQVIQTNLRAPIAFAEAMAGQAGLTDAAIVNVLDQKVANLNPDFFSYTMSKVALEGATTMLAQALAPSVRVNAVSPGLTLTSHDQSEVEFAAVSRENLLGRPVALADIASAVTMLLENDSVTGQNIFVDCGQRFITRSRDVMFAARDRALDRG